MSRVIRKGLGRTVVLFSGANLWKEHLPDLPFFGDELPSCNVSLGEEVGSLVAECPNFVTLFGMVCPHRPLCPYGPLCGFFDASQICIDEHCRRFLAARREVGNVRRILVASVASYDECRRSLDGLAAIVMNINSIGIRDLEGVERRNRQNSAVVIVCGTDRRGRARC